MVLKYPNLKDHIFEYDLLSDQECDQIVSLLDSREWGEFSWYQDFEQVDIDKESNWEACSGIKFNKYNVGDYLSPHYDHIRDFFEGQFRGIPVTSVVGVLNDDFEGGEFRFWKEHTVNIKKGSVLVFPALYLFPHEVTPVTKGVRYSWISWIV